jgi:hypothetical protein
LLAEPSEALRDRLRMDVTLRRALRFARSQEPLRASSGIRITDAMRFAITIVSNGDSTIATGAASLVRIMAYVIAAIIMATRLASARCEAFTTAMA